jgi:hypothetical protein
MFYLPLIPLAVFATVAMTRRSPRRAVVTGAVAIGLGVVAVTIAVLTGNLLLAYLGAFAWWFGLLVLTIRGAISLRHRLRARRNRTPPA